MYSPLLLTPEYRDYIWGGNRLKPGFSPIAEAWVVYEQDRIASGSLAGITLAEASQQLGSDLLGGWAFARTGSRFPLLIKLLDSAQWLSLQVHPNDEQAQRLAGPGFFGKTEAWHVLDAAPGAELIGGIRPGFTPSQVAQAIRDGTIVDLVQRFQVKAGDSLLVRAGLIHALGPGLMIYEVQQTSDLTYRVFDWNRPASQARPLHIEQSIEVVDPGLVGEILPLLPLGDGEARHLVSSAYFTLEILAGRQRTILQDTRGESFHALTVISGQARMAGDGWDLELGLYQSAVIPAACGAYQVAPQSDLRILKASV